MCYDNNINISSVPGVNIIAPSINKTFSFIRTLARKINLRQPKIGYIFSNQSLARSF